MRSRILPREEWDRLEVTKLTPIFPDFRPEDTEVVVVEEDGEIIASAIVLRVVHLESLWISPKKTNSMAGKHLWRGVVESAKKWAGPIAMAQTGVNKVCRILEKLGGVKLPADSYVVPLGR